MNATSKTGSLITLLKESYTSVLTVYQEKHSTLIGLKNTAKIAVYILKNFYYFNPSCFSEVFFFKIF